MGVIRPMRHLSLEMKCMTNLYSVYENCEINGKPYSLPMQKPWTNITNDEAARACFSKGEGWHMMTRAEWGLLANLSKKNGTLPHGNTNYGKYHADSEEKGVLVDTALH